MFSSFGVNKKSENVAKLSTILDIYIYIALNIFLNIYPLNKMASRHQVIVSVKLDKNLFPDFF